MEYFLYTSFVWGMFLVWLIPFQLYVVGLSMEQFWTWFILGTASEMVVSYPISKAILWGAPRITNWCKKQ